MIARLVFTIVWLALAGYMYFYYEALGKAFGGTEYIAHMGQAGAAGARIFVGLGCFATALVVLFQPACCRLPAIFMVAASAVFLMEQCGFLSLGIATYVRPLGFTGEYALFLLPVVGLLTLALRGSTK